MMRAFKKQGRIYCFGCGHELGNEMLCLHCGGLCPDYCVVQSSKFVAHKQKKASTGIGFARRPKAAKQVVAPQGVSEQKSHDDAEPQTKDTSEQQTDKNLLSYVALAVFILILTGGIAKFYLDHKATQEYSKKFIVALYGIKSGTDLSLKYIDAISSGWTDPSNTAKIAPRTDKKDLDKLVKVKVRIEQAMATLNETPEKFAEARGKLIRLHGIYEEIYALNISTPDTHDIFADSVDELNTKFFKAAGDLKGTMPEELIEALEGSVAKYRNLSFMVKGS